MGADLPMAMQEILLGRLSLEDYLNSLWGSLECAIFAWDDPVPGLVGPPLFAVRAGKQLLKGRAV
jgi:predicted ATP-grasp superfamily ATP-dependent carboligase